MAEDEAKTRAIATCTRLGWDAWGNEAGEAA
jgi:hypothetical protein